MKIATFNVNGIRTRLPHLLLWLEKEQPDVACLQELKALDTSFPVRELKDAGYGARWHGQQSWNGVAILAKGADPAETRRLARRSRGQAQPLHRGSRARHHRGDALYLPNGNPQPGPKFDYKLAWMERLDRHAKELFGMAEPVVLAGDYNVVPTDYDIYNPRSWKKDALLQPESRAAYAKLLSQGWIDSLRHLHPKEAIFTFWDYFRRHWETNSGLRIDHLLLNPHAAKRLEAAGVDKWVRGLEKASDHAPTWVSLAALKAKPRARR